MTNKGFQSLRTRKIFAIIDPENIPSGKILLRNGFVSVRHAEFDGLPGEVFELKLKDRS